MTVDGGAWPYFQSSWKVLYQNVPMPKVQQEVAPAEKSTTKSS